MTALIFVTHSTGVAAYADIASYDDLGVYRAPSTKARPLLHMNAIVAARGSAFQTSWVKMFAANAGTFDELIENMEQVVKSATLLCHENNETPNVSLVACGWSEKEQEWQTWRVWAEGRSALDLDEGSLVAEREPWISWEPSPPLEALEAAGAMKEGHLVIDSPEGVIADADIVRIMQVQRETVFPLGRNRGEGCIVGGGIMVTHLNHNETWSRVIHRWPDVIGEKMRTRGDDIPEEASSTAEPAPA